MKPHYHAILKKRNEKRKKRSKRRQNWKCYLKPHYHVILKKRNKKRKKRRKLGNMRKKTEEENMALFALLFLVDRRRRSESVRVIREWILGRVKKIMWRISLKLKVKYYVIRLYNTYFTWPILDLLILMGLLIFYLVYIEFNKTFRFGLKWFNTKPIYIKLLDSLQETTHSPTIKSPDLKGGENNNTQGRI